MAQGNTDGKLIRDLVGAHSTASEKIRPNNYSQSDFKGFDRREVQTEMKVVEHASENDDHDFGSPTVNRALRDVIKARNMLGRHQR